ncbi:MAG: glycosyl transferase [Caulobacteraceae bacterium]|nr:glycosyl transferase [Caulobacteraceae bacterium]
MRIAYIINSLEGGGAALPVPAVTQVMRDAGATVAVFALSRRDGRAIPAFDAAGLDWSVFPGEKSDHIGAAWWLLQALRRFQPTHLWTSLTQATLIGQAVGRVLRKPVVSWQHNAYLRPENLWLLRRTRRMTALWVADSESVASLSVARLSIPPERLVTWPLFQADPDAPQAMAWRPGDAFRLGSLGRLHPNKGYDVLVAALARLEAQRSSAWPAFEVVIAGEGLERPRLQALAETHNVTALRLAGFVPDPRGFLAGLHAYLQPSRAEGLCIAAHEAMQAGLPVVVSHVGEMPHSVRPAETGFVVKPDDAEGLADAIAQLLASPAHGHAMGQAGRALVLGKFSRQRFRANGEAALARLLQLA